MGAYQKLLSKEYPMTGSSRAAKRWRRKRVLGEDGSSICVYCGNAATTIDHIVPKAKGGSNRLANLVPACEPCNQAKADRDVAEWLSGSDTTAAAPNIFAELLA